MRVQRIIPFSTPLLLWLALPGEGEIWWLLFISLVPLLFALPQLRFRETVLVGLFCGMAHHGAQLYWLAPVLARYGGLSLWLAVLVLLLLVFYMALYFVAKVLFCRQVLKNCSPLLALFVLPAFWVGLDWVRSFLFSGFPWLDLGYGFFKEPVLIQSAALFGHSFLTFLLVAVNTLFVVLFCHRKKPGTLVVPVLVTAIIVVLVAGYSVQHLKELEGQMVVSGRETMRIGIVQGNVDQSRKWAPEMQWRTIAGYLEQTKIVLDKDKVALVVWPETAMPFYPTSYPRMTALFSRIKMMDVPILTGTPWYEIVDLTKRDIAYYNSAQLLLPDASYGGSYYKSHLVPYGEYIPLKRVLSFLSPLVETAGAFSPGTIEKPISYGAAQAGVLICFEAIFPDLARKWVKNGANVLINLTNDAWYGKTAAPYHSMAMSVLRAVETGRWMVRSANTGISGFIEPTGRVAASSEIFTTWEKGREVQFFSDETFFVACGYLFAPGCFFLVVVLFVINRKFWKHSGRNRLRI